MRTSHGINEKSSKISRGTILVSDLLFWHRPGACVLGVFGGLACFFALQNEHIGRDVRVERPTAQRSKPTRRTRRERTSNLFPGPRPSTGGPGLPNAASPGPRPVQPSGTSRRFSQRPSLCVLCACGKKIVPCTRTERPCGEKLHALPRPRICRPSSLMNPVASLGVYSAPMVKLANLPL